MSSEILYAGLIGALTALFFSLIFGIPKFIRFIVKKLIKNNDKNEQEVPNTLEEPAEGKIKKNKEKQKREKTNNIITSKRIEIIISLLLCVALYLLFLATAFTNERDTFICYTTKTGECFHSAVCQYISKSAYETTVYEACRNYRPCNHCNPCIERYATTITDRNFIAPILISVPLSIAVFFLLTYRKKEE